MTQIQEITNERLVHVPLAIIKPDPNQPRKTYEQSSLQDLAARIEATGGITKPIDIKLDPNHEGEYIIEDGQMRWLIYDTLRDDDTIPCRVVGGREDHETVMRQLMANIGNIPMNLLDIAAGLKYWSMLFEPKKTNKAVAEAFGMSQTKVSRLFKLLDAPKVIQDASLDVTNINTLSAMIQLHEIDGAAFHGALLEFNDDSFDQNGEKFWRLAVKQSQEKFEALNNEGDGRMTEERTQNRVNDPKPQESNGDVSYQDESQGVIDTEESSTVSSERAEPAKNESVNQAPTRYESQETPTTLEPFDGCILKGISVFSKGQDTIVQLRSTAPDTGESISTDYVVSDPALLKEIAAQLNAII